MFEGRYVLYRSLRARCDLLQAEMSALVDYLREFNEDLRQFNEDLEREANGECKVDRTVQPLESLQTLLVRL